VRDFICLLVFSVPVPFFLASDRSPLSCLRNRCHAVPSGAGRAFQRVFFCPATKVFTPRNAKRQLAVRHVFLAGLTYFSLHRQRVSFLCRTDGLPLSFSTCTGPFFFALMFALRLASRRLFPLAPGFRLSRRLAACVFLAHRDLPLEITSFRSLFFFLASSPVTGGFPHRRPDLPELFFGLRRVDVRPLAFFLLRTPFSRRLLPIQVPLPEIDASSFLACLGRVIEARHYPKAR